MASLGYRTSHKRRNFIRKMTVYHQRCLNHTFKFLNLGQNIICTSPQLSLSPQPEVFLALPAVQCISHCSTQCSEVCQVISYKERSRTQATQGCKAIFSPDTQGHGIKKCGTRERQFSLKMQGTVLLYQTNRNKLM